MISFWDVPLFLSFVFGLYLGIKLKRKDFEKMEKVQTIYYFVVSVVIFLSVATIIVTNVVASKS